MPASDDPAPIPKPVLQGAASTFGLLATPVRLHLLWLLSCGAEHDVGTLADATGESLATVSHHLAKLKLAGVVRARRDGKRQLYIAEDPTVSEVVDLVLGQRLRELDPASDVRRHA